MRRISLINELVPGQWCVRQEDLVGTAGTSEQVASWVFAPILGPLLFLLVLCVGSSGNSCNFVLR
jgi:hypothetical protein